MSEGEFYGRSFPAHCGMYLTFTMECMSHFTYRLASYLSTELYFAQLLKVPILDKQKTLLFELYDRMHTLKWGSLDSNTIYKE